MFTTENHLENVEKKKSVLKRIRAIDDQITLALEENPVSDPAGYASKVEYWEALKTASLSKLQSAVDFQQNQINEMREAVERRIASIQVKLDASKLTLKEKTVYFDSKVGSAKKKLDIAQTKACPKVRKLQLQKEALQAEIDAMVAQEAHVAKVDELNRKREKVERMDLTPPTPPDSDSDESDVTWTSSKVEEHANLNLKMEANGFYQAKATYKWEQKKPGKAYFAHEYSEEDKAAYLAKNGNTVVVPSPPVSVASSEESYNEEKHGDWKKWMRKKMDS
jgi:hypothetical protein